MKKRIITAITLVTIAVILFILPPNMSSITIALVTAIISAIAYKETLNLKESHKTYPPFIVIIGFICMMLIVFNRFEASFLYSGVSYGSIGLCILLIGIPSIFDKKGKYTTKEAFYLIGSTILLGLFFNQFMLLFKGDKWLLLYLLL